MRQWLWRVALHQGVLLPHACAAVRYLRYNPSPTTTAPQALGPTNTAQYPGHGHGWTSQPAQRDLQVGYTGHTNTAAALHGAEPPPAVPFAAANNVCKAPLWSVYMCVPLLPVRAPSLHSWPGSPKPAPHTAAEHRRQPWLILSSYSTCTHIQATAKRCRSCHTAVTAHAWLLLIYRHHSRLQWRPLHALSVTQGLHPTASPLQGRRALLHAQVRSGRLDGAPEAPQKVRVDCRTMMGWSRTQAPSNVCWARQCASASAAASYTT